MFIDAYFERPRILPHASSKLELLVEHAMQKSRRATVDSAHRLQVAEVFARPEQSSSIALGGAIAFANPLDGFGERTTTRTADEAALAHPDERLVVSDRVVAQLDPSVVATGEAGSHFHRFHRRP